MNFNPFSKKITIEGKKVEVKINGKTVDGKNFKKGKLSDKGLTQNDVVKEHLEKLNKG